MTWFRHTQAASACISYARAQIPHSILRKPHATHSCVLAYRCDAADVAFISDYGTAPLEVGAMAVQVTAV